MTLCGKCGWFYKNIEDWLKHQRIGIHTFINQIVIIKSMENCKACEMYGVITCVETSEWKNLSRERLHEIILDIIKTKNDGGKL